MSSNSNNNKRPAGGGGFGNLAGIMNKKARLDQKTANTNSDPNSNSNNTKFLKNPFLKTPVPPVQSLKVFLMQVRREARNYNPEKPPYTGIPGGNKKKEDLISPGK